MAGKPRVTKQKQLIMAILKESAVPLGSANFLFPYSSSFPFPSFRQSLQ